MLGERVALGAGRHQLVGVTHADEIGGEAAEVGGERCMMFRHRYDEVGLPCRNTMGAPEPTSTYAMAAPFTCVRVLGRAADVDTDMWISSLQRGERSKGLGQVPRQV